jgi:hypothetical protein
MVTGVTGVRDYRWLRNFDWGVGRVDDADALCIDVEILCKLCVSWKYIGKYKVVGCAAEGALPGYSQPAFCLDVMSSNTWLNALHQGFGPKRLRVDKVLKYANC